MKRKLIVIAALVLLCTAITAVFSDAAAIDDPSVGYVAQTAPYEDSSISLWFEHSFKKVMTSDITPSGMDTYSVYMAKNEIENAQFVLYSDETKANLTATIADFTNENGATLDASIYYQLYVTLDDLATTSYLGATTEEESFIREGEQPEALLSMAAIRRKFQLNAGKSQAFYIRLTSTAETEPGWYSSQLDIKNADGQIIKTATVYAYVWNFEIAEETALKSSFYIDNRRMVADNTYQPAYDYLLENRLMGMDVPGNFNSENEYLTNDRVSAIRVSAGVPSTSYFNPYINSEYDFSSYTALYNDVSAMPEWEDIKDKFYFYLVDEATSQEKQDLQGSIKLTMDDVKRLYYKLQSYWPGAAQVLPQYENHPYPYYYYNAPIADFESYEIMDSVQTTFDTNSVQLWCPQWYAFTPVDIVLDIGYDGTNPDVGAIEGYYKTGPQITSFSTSASGNLIYDESYFNWETIRGDMRDRIIANNLMMEEEGYDNYEFWTYCAGWNKSYTYCNHLIENSGIQTKLLFWQMYQMDITGYLYYGTNNWTEYDGENGGHIDTTVTGGRNPVSLKTNEHIYPVRLPEGSDTHSVWGNGVLFYPGSQVGVSASTIVGTVRVEIMRDGVEDYQMFTMLEELCGDSAADAIVDSVSKDITCYLSLPGFDRSAFGNDMDDYDVLAMQRKMLGNAVETASGNTCEHEWDEGTITLKPTCLKLGEITYTCTKCGSGDIQNVATLHAQGDCYKVTETIPATCTETGKIVYICDICGIGKYEITPALHETSELVFEKSSATTHIGSCAECGMIIADESHTYIIEYTNTCTEAGTSNEVCRFCGHTVIGEVIEAKGHYYRDGVCVTCGERETPEIVVVKGNVDGDADGQVSIADLFAMKAYLIGSSELDAAEFEAADLDSDGDVDITDFYGLKKYLISGEW